MKNFSWLLIAGLAWATPSLADETASPRIRFGASGDFDLGAGKAGFTSVDVLFGGVGVQLRLGVALGEHVALLYQGHAVGALGTGTFFVNAFNGAGVELRFDRVQIAIAPSFDLTGGGYSGYFLGLDASCRYILSDPSAHRGVSLGANVHPTFLDEGDVVVVSSVGVGYEWF